MTKRKRFDLNSIRAVWLLSDGLPLDATFGSTSSEVCGYNGEKKLVRKSYVKAQFYI